MASLTDEMLRGIQKEALWGSKPLHEQWSRVWAKEKSAADILQELWIQDHSSERVKTRPVDYTFELLPNEQIFHLPEMEVIDPDGVVRLDSRVSNVPIVGG